MSIAVVVTREQDSARLIHWAGLFGRAENTDVLVLGVTERPGDTVETENAAPGLAAAIETARSVIRDAPEFEAVTIEHESMVKAVLEQVRKREVSLLILGQRRKSKPDTDMLALFRDASCRTLLLRPGGDREEDAASVLVPTDRGPHATLALQLATGLAKAAGGNVTALYVQPRAGDDAELLGRKIVERRVGRALDEDRELVTQKVVLDDHVREVVAREGKEHDLVLAGSPDEWTARRVLFGTVQRTDLYGEEGTSVGVVRSSAPLPTRFVTGIRRTFEAFVPQLSRVDRVALADNLRTASRFNFDFIFLTCMSALIAVFGLIDDSGAVVIGAMLLAPLMTPLIGAGSAIVQGDVKFLFASLRSVTLGFFLAVGLSMIVGAIVQPTWTDQIEARGSPGFVDLTVAFFSGLAAAYATARPGLSAALPGVAIAASLVPPLAAAGIGWTTGHPLFATGAALLFVTNIIAIILGAAVSLYAAGVRSRHLHGRQQGWIRLTAILGLVLAGALVIGVSFRIMKEIDERGGDQRRPPTEAELD